MVLSITVYGVGYLLLKDLCLAGVGVVVGGESDNYN